MRFPTSKPVLLAYLVTLVGVSACGTTGRGPDATTNAATTLRGEYQALRDQIVTTMQALDQVTSSGDVSDEAYSGFSSAVMTLDSQGQAVQSAYEQMKTNAKAYIESWTTETAAIQNEEIRSVSEGRQADAQERIDNAAVQLDAQLATYEKFKTDLQDINAYLNLDPSGIGALADTVASAHQESTALLAEIDTVIGQLDQLIASFSSLESSGAPE